MFRELSSAALALAIVVARPPAPPSTSLPPCPPEQQLTLTYTDEFGPELADWPDGTLSVPKFGRVPETKLLGVEVELCLRINGTVQYANMDDVACTLTWELEGTAFAAPADPGSPIVPIDLSAGTVGGPVLLGPGESGSDAFDSGVICAPAQSFSLANELAAFTASPGDEDVVIDHAGMTTSASNGCGALFFDTEIFSTLSLSVTYTYCQHDNQAPVCRVLPLGDVDCQGDLTLVQLDGSNAFDPDEDELSFLWTSDCPNASFDDPTSPTPVCTIDTSGGCELECTVFLAVSDGALEGGCQVPIRIVEPCGGPGLDIKPTSCPNPVNTNSQGVLPVGVLGTDCFDVTEVDVSSLRLRRVDGQGGAVAPTRVQLEDVGTPFTGDPCDCHTLGGDGILDLSLKFDNQEVVEALLLDQEPSFSFVELLVTGELVGGESFESDGDCVRVQ